MDELYKQLVKALRANVDNPCGWTWREVLRVLAAIEQESK